MKYKLVYFDDSIQNIEVYQTLLKDDFEVTGSTETDKFEDLLRRSQPQGILLDLHMPLIDGLALHQRILESDHYNGCPVFFISGDISDESRLKTIRTGAIDFFSRQITPEELILRLKSKIKVYLQGASSLEVGNLRLDTNSFQTYIEGEARDLTLAEMRILSCIMRAMPNPVSKNEMVEMIWGEDPKLGKVNVHLSNINLKLWGWNHELKIKNTQISIVKKSI